MFLPFTHGSLASTAYAYDANLRPDTETITLDPDGNGGLPALTRVLDRSRDTLGRDTGFQILDGTTVENHATYAYSAADGRFASVTSPAGTFQYSYLENSDLVQTVAGPAHAVTNHWEAKRDALDWKENKAGQTVVSKYDYTVNGIGQRTQVETTGSAFQSQPADWTWGYDALGQVVSGDSPVAAFDRAYQYDQIGNRTRTAKGTLVLPSAANYTANALNQYTSAEGVTLPTTPAPAPPDDDGNLRFDGGVNKDNQPRQYLWDAETRLTEAKVVDGAPLVTYSHDAFGRRVSRTAGTSTTLFLYDGWNVVAEYASTSTSFEARSIHTWGLDLSGGLQGAGGVGGLLAVGRIPETGSPANAVWYFPTYDGNGNISEYLDLAGAPVAHYEYDPFGNEITPDSKKGGLHDAFAYRFSTKPFDTITGWYYYGFRYLIPVTGRWAGRDPIGERGGFGYYVFSFNATAHTTDLLGLDPARVYLPNGISYSPGGGNNLLNPSDLEAMRRSPPEGCREPDVGVPRGSVSWPRQPLDLNCCDENTIKDGKAQLLQIGLEEISIMKECGFEPDQNTHSCYNINEMIRGDVRGRTPKCWTCNLEHGIKYALRMPFLPLVDHWWVACYAYDKTGKQVDSIAIDGWLWENNGKPVNAEHTQFPFDGEKVATGELAGQKKTKSEPWSPPNACNSTLGKNRPPNRVVGAWVRTFDDLRQGAE